ncbi:Hypothetical predicted protein [Cloeon dipterum]|uniref:Heparan-alpha-glucosaminide N-acetyltransferase catalytic domain-containing protein n=1 Tax=Cloeon dipterum TaxID=197152 RepID=A0A8S1CMS9_9INSE|nr:Hypothetical predicted protein [Cloeon dipterum]
MSWLLERSHRTPYDLGLLGVDQAFLDYDLGNRSTAFLYTLSEDCKRCPYQFERKLDQNEGANFTKISTKHAWKFLFTEDDSGMFMQNSSSQFCELDAQLGQFGVYKINAESCEVETLSQPVNIYTSLMFVTSVLLLGGIFIGFCATIFNHCKNRRREFEPRTDEMKHQIAEAKRKRVSSLDTFRGISILLMIFVNDGAGGYQILEHVTWDGLQLADFVFPWFLWIMGVCIPISVKSQIKRTGSRLKVIASIFKRSCILFGLGVMLNTLGVGPKLETLRVFGVLQRFGVLYFLTAGICAICWPTNPKTDGKFLDLAALTPQWLIHLALHLVHLCLIFLLNVPGCPNGYLGPGGIIDDGLYQNCTGGVSGYLDKIILGEVHLYQNPTTKFVYKTGPFDPEGPYGCLPSILTVFLGVQAGTTLLMYKKSVQRLLRWVAWGGISLAFAYLISFVIPINKNLWYDITIKNKLDFRYYTI